MVGGGVSGGNYFYVESGDEYWISGVKSSGTNRHLYGSGRIDIDDDATAEYNSIRGADDE